MMMHFLDSAQLFFQRFISFFQIFDLLIPSLHLFLI